VPPGESRTHAWEITVPDGLGYLIYKAVGASGNLSDGEEGYLPVLSRSILVTESLPLPIRGQGERSFSLDKLLASGGSDTLQHQSFTVQMVSQPAWYAVLALPYLMEFPHECSEQLFNRLYANALARHIANSDPKIRRVFDLWRESSTLESPLFQNEDLKSVMIQESPWLLQAQRESESRKRVGLLFDANRLQEETTRGLQQLVERQQGDGLWPWFPGGRGSEFVSRYIITGFGRLRALGVDVDIQAALNALPRLDEALARQHREILKREQPENHVPSSMDALYLYGRSFFLREQPIEQRHQEAFDFFLDQARKHWTRSGSLQTQAHLALAVNRFGDRTTAEAILDIADRTQYPERRTRDVLEDPQPKAGGGTTPPSKPRHC
jgi:hypothetical protein